MSFGSISGKRKKTVTFLSDSDSELEIPDRRSDAEDKRDQSAEVLSSSDSEAESARAKKQLQHAISNSEDELHAAGSKNDDQSNSEVSLRIDQLEHTNAELCRQVMAWQSKANALDRQADDLQAQMEESEQRWSHEQQSWKTHWEEEREWLERDLYEWQPMQWEDQCANMQRGLVKLIARAKEELQLQGYQLCVASEALVGEIAELEDLTCSQTSLVGEGKQRIEELQEEFERITSQVDRYSNDHSLRCQEAQFRVDEQIQERDRARSDCSRLRDHLNELEEHYKDACSAGQAKVEKANAQAAEAEKVVEELRAARASWHKRVETLCAEAAASQIHQRSRHQVCTSQGQDLQPSCSEGFTSQEQDLQPNSSDDFALQDSPEAFTSQWQDLPPDSCECLASEQQDLQLNCSEGFTSQGQDLQQNSSDQLVSNELDQASKVSHEQLVGLTKKSSATLGALLRSVHKLNGVPVSRTNGEADMRYKSLQLLELQVEQLAKTNSEWADLLVKCGIASDEWASLVSEQSLADNRSSQLQSKDIDVASADDLQHMVQRLEMAKIQLSKVRFPTPARAPG